MKAERLLNILMVLQAKGRVNSTELARELEVSVRTIHRDMEALSASGVPVYTERGREGGWALSEGYRTNLTGMKAEELRALLLVYTTSALNDLGMGRHFDSALLKLLASTPSAYRKEIESIRQKVYIDSSSWPQKIHSTPLLPFLLGAIEKSETLLLEYDKKGTKMVRRVDPLGLVARGNIWYLVTREGEEYRTFRVSNLHGATLAGAKFKRPDPFDLQGQWEKWWESFRKRIPEYIVEVEVSPELLPRIQWFPYLRLLQTSSPKKDRHRLKIDFETIEWATRMVLWMGSDARVIAPALLRRRVQQEAQRIAAVPAGK